MKIESAIQLEAGGPGSGRKPSGQKDHEDHQQRLHDQGKGKELPWMKHARFHNSLNRGDKVIYNGETHTVTRVDSSRPAEDHVIYIKNDKTGATTNVDSIGQLKPIK